MAQGVDASVAVKWFLDEPESGAAFALLRDAVGPLIAPDLIIAEVSNALWHRVLRGDIGMGPAQEAAAHVHAHVDEIVPTAGLAPRGFAIALDLRHPVSDCYYLALAEAHSASFVTADRKLHRAVQDTPWAKLTHLLT